MNDLVKSVTSEPRIFRSQPSKRGQTANYFQLLEPLRSALTARPRDHSEDRMISSGRVPGRFCLLQQSEGPRWPTSAANDTLSSSSTNNCREHSTTSKPFPLWKYSLRRNSWNLDPWTKKDKMHSGFGQHTSPRCT